MREMRFFLVAVRVVLFAHSRAPSLARCEADSARALSCARANPNPLRGFTRTAFAAPIF